MPLNLGPVKPHVQAAAEQIVRRFGVSHIGGYRAVGSVPNSDHPKGLALDVMTRELSKGNEIAAWAIAHPDVTYVIWNRRIYDRRDSKGWVSYSGPSPHTDHVHISFAAKGTGGTVPVSTPGESSSPDFLSELSTGMVIAAAVAALAVLAFIVIYAMGD